MKAYLAYIVKHLIRNEEHHVRAMEWVLFNIND